jgi:uncharacterized membrane-anchored protein YhcB (DUF1043 family)
MAELPLRQRIEQTAKSGVETGIGSEMTKEQIAEIKAAFDNMSNDLKNYFARTAAVTPETVRASKALASFFNSQNQQKQEAPEVEQDNKPKGPGFSNSNN